MSINRRNKLLHKATATKDAMIKQMAALEAKNKAIREQCEELKKEALKLIEENNRLTEKLDSLAKEAEVSA